MIKKKISRTTFQEHLIDFVRDEMYEAAIKDDGIYSTFKLHNRYFTTGEIRITLRYCKLDCDDKWLPAQGKIFYKDCPELWVNSSTVGEVYLPYITPESLKQASDRINMDMVKNDNAIWSTIKVQPCYDHFDVSYEKAYVDNDNMTIKWKPEFDEYVAADIKATKEAFKAIPRYLRSDCMVVNPDKTLQGLEPKEQNSSFASEKTMTAQEMEIENTKRTLQRLRENSYYGLYPRHAGLTCHFDEKLKEDIKASFGRWKARAEKDTKEKEKKDMNVTLMVVPNGMNKDFVDKVKTNFQSNNSQRLFVASTDIDYSCEYEPIKTKYDLFENWVKTGKVDIVYFMLGFEKDPDTRAFEAFVRGIMEVPGKIVVNVVYQKDDIRNDTNHLRTLYFDEEDTKEDFERAAGLVVKEAKAMSDVYGLDDNGLDIIKYSRGKIDASDELIIGKIMDVAFAEDEDAKPKKGGKK